MVAYRLTAAECFVAMLDDAQTVPPPLHNSGTRPDGLPGVTTIACRQLRHRHEELPHAVGGLVHVAVIRPGSVTRQRVCDLIEAAPVVRGG